MKPMEVVEAYLVLHNSHDLDGVMDLYSSAIEFELAGVWVKTGKSAIQELEEFDAVTGSQLSFEQFQVDDNQVSCHGTERNEWVRLAGLGEIKYQRCAFTVDGEKIVRAYAQYEAESVQAITAALQTIAEWAEVHRPGALEKLMPGGEFRYGTLAARAWLSLLEDWNRSAG